MNEQEGGGYWNSLQSLCYAPRLTIGRISYRRSWYYSVAGKSSYRTSEIYICRVHIMIRVRGVKRIFISFRRCRYAIEEIFTSANMIITEFDK